MSVKVLTRDAAPSDYTAVLDMNRTVYEGFDYLPVYYHIYQHNPSCHPFVGEVNGRIVGYFVLRVTEDGQTALSVAGRMDPSFIGKGVFHQIINSAMGMFRQRQPTVKYLRHAGVGAKYSDSLEKAAKSGHATERIVDRWNLLVYSGLYGSSKYDIETPEAVELSLTEAESVFSDVTNLVCLFPTGLVICYQNWRPLRVNYQTIMDVTRSHYTVCSYRGSHQTKLRAASFGFICPIQLGVRLDIYYYDVITEVSVLRQHVIKQVKHVVSLRRIGEPFNVLLHFPQDYAVQDVKDSLRDYLGENTVSNKAFSRHDVVALEGVLGPDIFNYGAKL